MERTFVKLISEDKELLGKEVLIKGWISKKRVQQRIIFLDIVDASGEIQVVCNSQDVNCCVVEQSVEVVGIVAINPNNSKFEIEAQKIHIIGDVYKKLSPSPRSTFDIFNPRYADYTLKNRHLFIRNPKVMAAMKARHLVLGAVHNWFRNNGFIEITAPILTPVLLYDVDTGIQANVNGENVFLTQCVGFYLESAVHAFEKVYNIGPSFRGKESISKRHLTEYWHIKAEMAFVKFDDFFTVVEDLVSSVVRQVEPYSAEICNIIGEPFCNDALKTPFPRITYTEAVKLLNENGIYVKFGQSINDIAEDFLAKYYESPVWVTYNARSIEGFPYKIVEENPELTYTADLIASKGFGEILGIADKITNPDELQLRMSEKAKSLEDYAWFYELRKYGTVPHCGVGMGVERLIRWLFQLPHVRDAMPFPRSMGRKIYP